ncbi:hypothetical protein V1524DRAFT_443859 [Lipomyces starkeyi]
MADSPQLMNTELHSITRQQVYNIWLTLARKEWEETPLMTSDLHSCCCKDRKTSN